jgi:hypothetical protein
MSRRLLAIAVVIAPALALVVTPALAPAFADPPAAAAAQVTLRSKDGTIEVTLPRGWEDAPDGSPMRKAVVQPDTKIVAKKTGTSSFAIAFRSAKEDFTAKTLAEYAARTLEVESRKLVGSTVSTPRKLLLGGKQALQYELRHERNGLVLIYSQMFTESAKHWIQIRCITTPSRRKDLDEDCVAIAASFRELPPAK